MKDAYAKHSRVFDENYLNAWDDGFPESTNWPLFFYFFMFFLIFHVHFRIVSIFDHSFKIKYGTSICLWNISIIIRKKWLKYRHTHLFKKKIVG